MGVRKICDFRPKSPFISEMVVRDRPMEGHPACKELDVGLLFGLLQSNHHQQTNIHFLTGRMSFLSPNQQCQSTKGKISHSMYLHTPSSPGGLPTLSLTTNSYWLSNQITYICFRSLYS